MAEEPLFVRVALNAWFVPLHIAAFIFQDRILRPRGARPLALVRALVVALALLLDDSVVNPSSTVSIVLTGVVMPLTCFTGPVRERAAVAGLLVSTVCFAELVGTAVWMVVAPGIPTSSYAGSWVRYDAHMVGTVAAAATEFAWLAVLARTWLEMRAETGRGAERGETPLVLAAYPVLQACGMLVLATPVMIAPDADPGLLFAVTVPCALCLVSDLAVLSASGRMRQRARMEREARELSARLDEVLWQSEERLANALQLAHIRHDVRNHLYVIGSLAAQGDARAACDYARDLAAGLRDRSRRAAGRDASGALAREARSAPDGAGRRGRGGGRDGS